MNATNNKPNDIQISLMLYFMGIIFIIASIVKTGDIVERIAVFSLGCLLIIQGYMS